MAAWETPVIWMAWSSTASVQCWEASIDFRMICASDRTAMRGASMESEGGAAMGNIIGKIRLCIEFNAS